MKSPHNFGRKPIDKARFCEQDLLMPGPTSPTSLTTNPLLVRVVPSGDELEHALEEFIFSDGIKPGHRLPSERILASHFSVSRHTLREVLSALEGRGLIKIEPGRGAFVEDQTRAQPNRVLAAARQGSVTPAHLIEARLMIECAAAGLAALRRDDEDLRVLRALYVEHMNPDIGPEQSAYADIEFHERIAQASRNPVILILFSSIKNLVFGTITRSLTDHSITDRGMPLHAVVLDAIEAQDVVRAQEVMRELLLIGQEMYGDDLHLPLSKVLNRRAEMNPDHRTLLDAASRIIGQETQTTEKG
jgi:GntR family transcriptional repressor for pyruvate dehydrogenase complex